MSKGKNFSDFTYGVGLDINATSFKQVKNDLKLNLDNLSKMVKSYGKVLKIDPNADLSKLFEEMRKIQGIVDGINNSDNSFAGFVDKGVLGRIEALESGLKTVGNTSDEIKTNLDGLRSSIVSLLEPLKAAGQIKFPATFENLFGDVKDQSSQIKNVTSVIKTVETSLTKLQQMWESLGQVDGNNNWNDDDVFDWITRIDDIKNELSDAANIDTKKLQSFISELENIGGKLGSAMATMSKDKLKSFGLNEEYVVSEINNIIDIIKTKKIKLEEELKSLNEVQTKFLAKQDVQSSSGKSLGIQSDYTAQVKVSPKTNEVEWVNKINDTITNIEPQLKSVMLTPTFSKGKNIQREIDGNLAQINHTIGVDLKVADNLDKFNEQIKNIDTSIKNAKSQLEKNGNFKIRFEYEEGGKFKDAAYKIINQFKKIDVKFYIANGKKFIQDVAGLRTKATKELKDIPANVIVSNSDSALSNLDTFRSEIEKKIGNIGVNLNIQNMPEVFAQATLMRDAIEKAYSDNPVGLGIGSSVNTSNVENVANPIEALSEAAKAAKIDLEKCKSVLKSLMDDGFDSPEFLRLGDISPDGKKIRGSTKKLEELLNKYKALQDKLPEDVGSRWQELYPEANGDITIARKMANDVQKELKKVESELTQYLQKQIAYAQNRYNQAENVLQKEKEISAVKKEQTDTKSENASSQQTTKQLAMSAEDATKKVKSLNGTLREQKKVLEDLETNGIDASSFARLGEWDKESGSFKKNKKDIQALVNKYKELRDARKNAGGTKAVGEEASLRGKLSSILRQQKKHVSEIIAKNQAELKSAKEISNAYKEVNNNKSKIAQTKTDVNVDATAKKVEQLIKKLNNAKLALSNLKSDGLSAVGTTGLGDNKGVLKDAGIKESLKEVVDLYNKLIAKKKELESTGGTNRSASQIKSLIDSLNKAKAVLDSRGILGLSDTGIGDVKNRLIGSSQTLNELVSQYHELLIAKKQFEQSGDITSNDYTSTVRVLDGITQQLKVLYQDQKKEIDARIQGLQSEVSKKSEYVKVAQECKRIEELLADVHKNQVEYAQSRVELYAQQIAKEKELLQFAQQRTQEEAKQQKQVDTNIKIDKAGSAVSTNTSQSSSVVKLDGPTLNSLAKDTTLQAIDGKIGNILSHLGSGINITGSNISIEASNVSVSGGTTTTVDKSEGENKRSPVDIYSNTPSQAATNKQVASSAENARNKQKELNAELERTEKQTEYVLSSTLNMVREVNGEIAKSSDTYKTVDRVNEKTENWSWVSHGKEEPPTFEHTSTVYKTNMEAYNKLYQDFIKALSKQKQIEQQIATAEGPTSKLQAELTIQKDITENLEAQLKSHEKLYTQEAQQAAITEAIKRAQQEIAKSTGAQNDKDVKKQNTDLIKIVDSAQKKYKDMQYTMSNFKVPMADSAIAKFKEYEQLLTTLKRKQQEINANPDLLKNENYSKNFDTLLQKMQKVQSEFTTLQKSSEGFLSKIRSIEDIKSLGSTFDPTNLEQMHDEMQAFASQVGIGSAKLIEFNDVERTAVFEIKNGQGQVQQLTVAYDAATNSLGRYTSQTRTSLSETQKFLNSLKHSFQNVARYVASFGSVYRLFAIIKQGFTYVRDIDSALTELKKVTDETDASYNKFLQDMSKTGKVVGATVQDLTTMAAEWARLGYSMKEAGQLAESTAVLLNVSEFEDATKASEALISTMQAFQYTADESGHVVDILNEIGNNYAVSSDGIATALQDSASALMEGGNNLEQAVALVAAANRVVNFVPRLCSNIGASR